MKMNKKVEAEQACYLVVLVKVQIQITALFIHHTLIRPD